MLILKAIGIFIGGIVLLFICIVIISEFLAIKSKQKHKKFLTHLEGKFLYLSTNKKGFKKYNDAIKLQLSKEIIQIDLIDSKINSIFDTDKIHRLISKEKLKDFPIAIKVKNGVVIKTSFHKDFLILEKTDDEEKQKDLLLNILKWYENT